MALWRRRWDREQERKQRFLQEQTQSNGWNYRWLENATVWISRNAERTAYEHEELRGDYLAWRGSRGIEAYEPETAARLERARALYAEIVELSERLSAAQRDAFEALVRLRGIHEESQAAHKQMRSLGIGSHYVTLAERFGKHGWPG